MLTSQQQQAASAIAKGQPLREIAESLRVSIRTVQRWQLLPEFSHEVERLQEVVSVQIDQAVQSEAVELSCVYSRLPSVLNRALTRLEAIIDDPDSRASDILKASQLLARWSGWESDFNMSLANLRNYGIVLCRSDSGEWFVDLGRSRRG
jgi:hypothetical protein